MGNELPKYTQDDTLNLIQSIAQERGDGGFTIKVQRKRNGALALGSPPDIICVVSGATAAHIGFAEQWLARIAGGGRYELDVSHVSSPMKRIGGLLVFNMSGDSRSFDPAPFYEANWKGPPVLEYPDRADFAKIAPVEPVYVGASSPRPQHGGPQQAQPMPVEEALRAENARLAAQVAKIEQDRVVAEMRRESDAKLGLLERKLDQLTQVAAMPKPPAEDSSAKLAATINALIGGLAPIVATIIQTTAQSRQAMLQLQQTAALEQQKLLQALITKPAVPPEYTAMFDQLRGSIEKLGEKDPHSASMLQQMADMTGGLMQTTMSIVNQAIEGGLMGGKQSEPTGLIVLREIGKMVEAFGSAQAQAVGQSAPRPRPIVNVPPSLPSKPMPPPATQTVDAPAFNGVAQPNGKANGTVQAPVAQPSVPMAPLDEIEQMIRAEADPQAIAAKFIASVNDPSVATEINEAGGLVQAFQQRLGIEWILPHQEYLKTLMAALEETLKAHGFVQEDDAMDDGEVDAPEAQA